MGCMVCNPFCGKCRAPHPKPAHCATCDRLVMRARTESWVCPDCGNVLPPRPRMLCNWSGIYCDIPCMYNLRENATGETHPCRWPDGQHLYKSPLEE